MYQAAIDTKPVFNISHEAIFLNLLKQTDESLTLSIYNARLTLIQLSQFVKAGARKKCGIKNAIETHAITLCTLKTSSQLQFSLLKKCHAVRILNR